MLKRGSLIIFEGCDRSGKTTQVKMLIESLNSEGIKAQMMRFPDRSTSIGKVCGDYLGQSIELDDHAVHLMFAANRWELMPRIREHLANGVNVIIDRYAFSGVAFSASKPGMDLEWCKRPDVGLPRPDKVIFLDLTPEVQQQRGGFGGERYENAEMQRRVYENYQLLMDDSWVTVNADKTVEDLHVELKQLVKNIISEEKGAVRNLWTD